MQTYTSPTHVLKVIQDSDVESPRNWDNLSKMIFFGKHKDLGDRHSESLETPFDSRQDFMERGAATLAKQMGAAVCLPVHLYDHSMIGISTSYTYPYNCPWDSGTCGFVVVTKEAIRKEYGKKRVTKELIEKATAIAKGEVETLNQYISGDIWGFSLEDKEGEEIDSCWGFYGSDINDNGMLEHVSDYGPFVEA